MKKVTLVFLTFVFFLFNSFQVMGLLEESITPYTTHISSTVEALLRDMILVNGGSFEMGCTSEQQDCKKDEKPIRQLELEDFYIGKYEVTQAQWLAVMDSLPPRGGANACRENTCPIVNVSWYEVHDFIEKLNRMTDKNFRLPTEEEWEFAARGGINGKPTLYAGGNDMEKLGWFTKNSEWKTHTVGSREANELGLYDMSGNVWEMCSNLYSQKDSLRAMRGGSWYKSSIYCRVSKREGMDPNSRSFTSGFRLAYSE